MGANLGDPESKWSYYHASMKTIGAATKQVLKTHATIDAGNEFCLTSQQLLKKSTTIKNYYNYGHHPWEVLRKLRAPLQKNDGWKTIFLVALVFQNPPITLSEGVWTP